MIYSRFPVLLAVWIACVSSTSGVIRLLPLPSNLSDAIGHFFVPEAIAQTTQPNTAQLTEEPYDQAMKAGYEATLKREYRKALQQFKKALELRPNDKYAKDAIQNVQKYLQANPQATSSSNSPSQDSNSFWIWLILGAIILAGGLGTWFLSSVLRKYGQESSAESLDESETPPLSRSQVSGNRGSSPLVIQSSESTSSVSDKVPEPVTTKVSPPALKAESKQDKTIPVQQTTRLQNVDFVEELIKDLHEPDPQKRRRAIWELAQKSDSRAVQPMIELMMGADSQERTLILEALSQISTRTLKPLNQALALSLQDKNPQVRKNAIRDVTKIYDLMSQMSQLLQHASEDPDKEVQEIANWAMKQLNLQPPRLERLSVRKHRTPSLEKSRNTSSE
jgi:hypothetical protein